MEVIFQIFELRSCQIRSTDCYTLSNQHQLNISANRDSGGLESPNTTCNLNFKKGLYLLRWSLIPPRKCSAPSCDQFGPHGE